MAEIGSAFVSILPSAKGFGTQLNSQVGPQVNKAGLAAGAGFGRSLLKGFIAIGVITKLTQFVGDAFTEAREAQKVSALVDNAIKQTGGVANVTAAQVDRLSDAFSRKTGIDDEQIASSSALLLTFKNVRDVGSGMANIFNRATRASADLAASGFGSMESTAKQLGKALNDPLKGLTALGRAGVQFSKQQVARIKNSIAENNIFRAQRIILKEVESQVGGAAEATATDADKASVALGNLKEQIGTALLPGLNALARTFTNSIAPAISNFVTNLQSGEGSAGRFGSLLRDKVLPILRQYGDYVVNKVVPAFRDALVPVINAGKKAFDSIRESVRRNKPELTQLFNAFKKVAEFVQTKVIPAQIKLSANVLPVLGLAIKAIITVAGVWVREFNRVADGIAAVRGVVSTAITKFKAFKTGIEVAAKGAKAAISRYIGQALGPIRTLISTLQSAIDKFNELRGKRTGGVKGGGGTGADFQRLGQTVGERFAQGIESSSAKVTKATQKMLDRLRGQLDTLKSDFVSLRDSVAGAFTGNLFEAETAGDFIKNLMGTKGQLQALKAAFTKLIGWGLKPEFLSQLFQSGNGGLILDLAAGTQAQAQEANALFGDVTSLSNELGTSVADAKLGDRIKDVKDEIKELRKDVKGLAREIGHEVGDAVNGAARGGRRRARAA